MINWDIISAVIFYLIIFGLFLKFRNKFEVQGKIFVMYKTKRFKLLQRWTRFRRDD